MATAPWNIWRRYSCSISVLRHLMEWRYVGNSSHNIPMIFVRKQAVRLMTSELQLLYAGVNLSWSSAHFSWLWSASWGDLKLSRDKISITWPADVLVLVCTELCVWHKNAGTPSNANHTFTCSILRSNPPPPPPVGTSPHSPGFRPLEWAGKQ